MPLIETRDQPMQSIWSIGRLGEPLFVKQIAQRTPLERELLITPEQTHSCAPTGHWFYCDLDGCCSKYLNDESNLWIKILNVFTWKSIEMHVRTSSKCGTKSWMDHIRHWWPKMPNKRKHRKGKQRITENNNLIRFEESLKYLIDPDHGLLDKLRRRNALSLEDEEKIKHKDTYIERNRMVLQCVNRDKKLDDFLLALRDADQAHVANYIHYDGGNLIFAEVLCFILLTHAILDHCWYRHTSKSFPNCLFQFHTCLILILNWHASMVTGDQRFKIL